jgi:hypothetical protein
MTPKEVAQALDNRILAFLQNIASSLAAKKIFTHQPVHVWDEESKTYEWWLLVYPWTRVTRPPENAIIVEVRFERYKEFLDIVLEFETADGTLLYRYPEGDDISPEKADISEFEMEFERYDDPDSVRQIVARVEDYIKRARSDESMGPRDWSPRLKGSESKKVPDEPVRVNIAEEKEWKENWTWESSDFDYKINRLADAYYEVLLEDKGECESLVEDILGKFYDAGADEGPREWAPRPRKIGPEGVKKVCKAWHDHELESVDFVIRDTIQYMYEDAMIPDDGDIQHAIREAKDKFIEDPDLDYEIWDPLLEKGRHEQDIMIQLMNEIHYNRAPRAYDRYIAFDFINAGVVKDLLAAWPKKDRGWVKDSLKSNEFRALRNNFVGEFFEQLEKDMKGSDPDNRTNWKLHWGGMIVDEDRMEPARKEIREFLKTAPELPEDEDE